MLPYIGRSPSRLDDDDSSSGRLRICCALTRQGRPCHYIAKEDSLYCGRHMIHECAICLCEIDRHTAIRLPCGHIFHKDCMSKCVTPTCPMCRAIIPAEVCVSLFHSTRISPVAQRIFSLPTTGLQQTVFTIMEGVLTIAESFDESFSGLLQDMVYWFGNMLRWNRIDIASYCVNMFANTITSLTQPSTESQANDEETQAT
jgi:hypothetical protein